MRHLDWKPEYQSGLESLDYEHRQLIDTINSVCENLAGESATEDVLEYLGQLFEKINSHFALEERLMQEQNYELYAGHKAQHSQLLENLRMMMDAYEDGTCKVCNKTLDECLVSWFSQHFQTGHGVLIHIRD